MSNTGLIDKLEALRARQATRKPLIAKYRERLRADAAEEIYASPLTNEGNHGIMNLDDGWRTTKNGEHFLLGKGGEIKAGLGGKFTGKAPAEAFGKTESSGGGKSGGGSTASARGTKQEPSTQQAEPVSSAPFDIKNVSKKDVAAIEGNPKGYVGTSNAMRINARLREDGYDSIPDEKGNYVTRKTFAGSQKVYNPSDKELIDTLDRNMAPLGQAGKVYRFIQDNDPLFKAKVGETVTNKGYTSTTDQDNHAFSGRPGKVEIRIPASSKVYVPKTRGEGETIIHRNANYRVVERSTTEVGVTNIVVELLED